MGPEEILSVLEGNARRIAAVSAGLDGAVLQAAPGMGEWSAAEVLAHLRACGDMWGGAIERIVAEDRPSFRAVNPGTWIAKTDYPALEFSALFSGYERQRRELLALLRSLPAEDWERSGTVSVAGKPLERSVRFYGDWLARHERPHVRQIERAVSRE